MFAAQCHLIERISDKTTDAHRIYTDLESRWLAGN